jgi:hypothetical protein
VEPAIRADPQGAVARDQQAGDVCGGQLLTACRLPWGGADAIETVQSEFLSQPEIAVERLRQCMKKALGETIPHHPRRVPVLANVECWIKGEGARAQRPGQQKTHDGARLSDAAHLPHYDRKLVRTDFYNAPNPTALTS